MPPLALVAVALSAAFAGLAGGAFVWTVRAAFRHGRPVCSWLDARLWQLAALPLLAAIGLALVSAAAGPDAFGRFHGWTNLLLSLGTALGTAAAVLFRTVLVYEDGIRSGAGRRLVDWSDVSDYAAHADGRYVFLSYPRGTDRRRADVRVPRHHRARFEAVVSACVDARLDYGLRRDTPRRTTSF